MRAARNAHPRAAEEPVIRAVATIDGEDVVVAGGRFEKIFVGRSQTRIAVWYPARTKLFDGDTGMDREHDWRIHPDDLRVIQEAHPDIFRVVEKRWREAAYPDHVFRVGRSFVRDLSDGKLTRALVVLLHPGPGVNGEKDDDRDASLRRVLSFARREAWDIVEVSYLFSRVGDSPDEVRAHAEPIAEGHDEHLRDAASLATKVIAAWGSSIPMGKKQPATTKDRDKRVVKLLKEAGHATLQCFARDGHPREFLKYPPHPLNIPRDTPMGVWSPPW
jgi:hypothetical protein